MVFSKFIIAFKAIKVYILDYSSAIKTVSVIRKTDQSDGLLTSTFVLIDMKSPYIFQEYMYTVQTVFHNYSPFNVST